MNLAASVAGMMLGGVASALRTRLATRPGDRVDHLEVPGCDVAIVLCGRDNASPVSRTIDDMTGRRGFSHVLLDPCRMNARGERVVIDYTARRGVHWTTMAKYSHRRNARVELGPETAREVWGCVRSQLGRPFSMGAIALGIDSRATCVGLIVACLPWAMQEDLHALKIGPCISPNTIAEYFGVEAT